jgi:probable rRNA maturation factor
MGVLIDNRQNRFKIPPGKVRKKAQAILDALDCPDAELSILLVDDPEIEKLNGEYLGRRGPTNVIAFPMREGGFPEITPQLLGDVVISIDTAAREALEADIPFETRFMQLLVHGILHLLGYDHETPDADAEAMERKSEALLEKFGAL